MADNVTLDAGSGGDVIAADDVSSVKYQLIQLVTGADGSAKTLVTGSSGLPVTDASGSLTVDAPVGTPVFVRLSDGSSAITTLAVSLASVPSHAVTNAGTFAVQVDGAALTALQLIDDAVSGSGFNISQMNGVNVSMGNGASGTGVQRVTIANDSTGIIALTTSTASIGKLAANSGVDIGDVDVTSVVPGTGATNLGKAIDTATGGTDTGVLVLATRDDALSSLTPAEGDNVQLRTDANGALWIIPSGTVTISGAVSNSGTFAVQVDGSALTALQLIDDAVATTGSAITAKGLTACGTDGTNARALKTDTSGELQIDVLTIAAGDNNIGNVDLASAIPAGTNLIGQVSASHETATIYNGTTALTPKFAVIDAATSGDNTLVSAVSSKKIRVLAAFLVAAGTVNVRFESGAGGTALTGQMNLVVNAGFVLPFNPVGWFETASNTLLNLELSGAVSVDGSLVYVEV